MRALGRGAGARFPRDLEDGHLPGRTSGTLAPVREATGCWKSHGPAAWHPQVAPGGSKPFLNRQVFMVLSAHLFFLTDKD